MSDGEKLAALDAAQSTLAGLQTYRLQLIAGLEESGHAKEIGARSTARLLMFRYQLDPTEAHSDVRFAKALGKYPAVKAALPDPLSDEAPTVVIDPAQAEAIVAALEKVPSTVHADDRAAAGEQMIQAAQHLSPVDLRKLGKLIRDTLDADGPEPAEDEAAKREAFWMKNASHGVEFGGYLANDNAELLRALIDTTAKPHKTVDGERDPRSRNKRQADALVVLLQLAAGSNGVPGRPRVVVTIDYDDLRDATSRATGDLIYGNGLSASAIRRLACDAGVLPIVLGSDSQPLDVGREERFVTTPIRNALIKRDRGCVVCKAPPSHCHAHHLIPWYEGGPTSLDNLVLLCSGDHTDVHSGHRTVRIVDGKVEVTRPGWATPGPLTRLDLPESTAPLPWSRTTAPGWITPEETAALNPWGEPCPPPAARTTARETASRAPWDIPAQAPSTTNHEAASPGP